MGTQQIQYRTEIVMILYGGPRIFKVHQIFILMIVNECLRSIISKSTFLFFLVPLYRSYCNFNVTEEEIFVN